MLSTVKPSIPIDPEALDMNARGTLNVSVWKVGSLLKPVPDSLMPTTTKHFVDVGDVARAGCIWTGEGQKSEIGFDFR